MKCPHPTKVNTTSGTIVCWECRSKVGNCPVTKEYEWLKKPRLLHGFSQDLKRWREKDEAKQEENRRSWNDKPISFKYELTGKSKLERMAEGGW